ncbi:glutathione S-transferase family protein [Stenotrophomonas sp. C3(2023)]|uniref:glutathione S-transferase family protein n=1 Tax=Stenotrophomonas sp. C3(2023) TaxID=3080277 RepID=UPI00293C5A60|nr:glutathione S-transferase family protein [Stenotrophomonas sp. C3(2023)]MDV3469175.1 glutathione S-transferase family protein [Stenotrophomonas sp. C3(2023)]
MNASPITLYHAAHSRSSGVVALLEALQADYRIERIDLRAGDNLTPAYLAVNPMGKVPAIVDQGVLVTEQTAIYPYLAERFAQAGLAPMPGDPARGPFLRWMAFYGACFEPALTDLALKREPAPRSMSPYADAATVLATVEQQLAEGPYFLGARLCALDFLWGSALGWMIQFGLIQPGPATAAFAARMQAHPAMQRSGQVDAALLAAG